jgi:tetratricopeptide (TPR) repeat protein
LGEQFKNSHHYCTGLNFLNRYYRSPVSGDGKSMLHFAINEFTYMVDHLVPNSSLAGESFLERGVAFALSKRDAEAAGDFQQAVIHNPRLAKAYLGWADFLADRKRREEALKVVTEGLRHVPDSRPLQRRYESLGGKLPYPESVIAVAPLKEGSTESRKAEELPSHQAVPAAIPDASAPSTRATQAPSPASSENKRPYCRFCPDEPYQAVPAAIPNASAPSTRATQAPPPAPSENKRPYCRFCPDEP